MEITKSEIEKFFGSILNYTEFLALQIDKHERQLSELKSLNISEIFSKSVYDMSINNLSIQNLLQDTKTAMVQTITEQIERNEKLKKLAYSL